MNKSPSMPLEFDAIRNIGPAAASRRGVLLLVVLSMLTLFLLLGTTFLVLASRARTTSRAFLKLAEDPTRTTDASALIVRDAALQVIRGSSRTTSVSRFHDLLADRYGLDGGTDWGVTNNGGVGVQRPEFYPSAGDAPGQFLRLPLYRLTVSDEADLGAGGRAPVDNRSGRVLTFLNGPQSLVNKSFRIVTGLDEDGQPSSDVVIERPASLAAVPALFATDSTVRVRINDAEFSGAGFSLGGSNYSAVQPNWSLVQESPTGTSNEGYDAADAQNIALAVGSNPRSFDRPEMIDFWVRHFARKGWPYEDPPDNPPDNTLLGRTSHEQTLRAILNKTRSQLAALPVPDRGRQAEIAMRFRRASLRPFAFDHTPDKQYDFAGRPLAAGSLPLDPLRNDPGDVDTDGDGAIDAVWIDLGYAPLTMPDDKLAKPLFAVKCIDLGGRLSLNAHGSPMHLQAPAPNDPRLARSGAGQPALRAGIGAGPLDVRLVTVTGATAFQKLILGNDGAFGWDAGIRRDVGPVLGRYGDSVGSLAGFPANVPRAGLAGMPQAAREARDRRLLDPPWLPVRRDIQPNYWAAAAQSAALGPYGGAPPDMWGRLTLGISHRGHPLYLNAAAGLSDVADPPYSLDLYAQRAGSGRPGQVAMAAWVDQPFTPGELEAMLRPFDRDNAAVLPQRLLAMSLRAGNQFREACTTETWDTPGVLNMPATVLAASPDLDHDLLLGLRMNLNRPFGDGIDNSSAGSPGEGVVDEPGDEPTTVPDPEPGKGSRFPLAARYKTSPNAAESPLTRGLLPLGMPPQPGPDDPGLRARQVYAWHLFKLLDRIQAWTETLDSTSQLLLCSGTFKTVDGTEVFDPREQSLKDPDPEKQKNNVRAHSRRVLAQWAVNVVDFLDADATMTPFRYAEDGGSSVNHVVWGCEAPDLVITETLAFHDRGIRIDADNDDNAVQVRPPEASLFVELTNIRDPKQPNPPRELYTAAGVLDLARRPSAGTPPIWRLALTQTALGRDQSKDVFKRFLTRSDTEWLAPAHQPDPVSADAMVAGSSIAEADRFVWFTAAEPASAGTKATPANTFVFIGGTTQLARGDVLVVGPRAETSFGETATGAGQKSPQKIILSAAAPRVRVLDFDGTDNPTIPKPTNAAVGEPLPPPGGRSESKACWVEIKSSSVGLNVSLPPDSLTSPPANDLLALPLPPQRDLARQGTHANAATVFLQRLANPTRPHNSDSTDANWNPYVTVDFMPIDLTVVNGLTDINGLPGDKFVKDLPNKPFHFHTRQRGLHTEVSGAPAGSQPFKLFGMLFDGDPAFCSNPWVPAYPHRVDNPPGPQQTTPSPNADQAYFKLALGMRDGNIGEDCPIHTLGWTNISFGRRLGPDDVPAEDVGAPSTPWPWLTWNDRPFLNEYELLLVPRTAPGRLLTNYRNPARDPEATVLDPDDVFSAGGPAGHLLPFTAINDPPRGTPAKSHNADILFRLFSFVRVPTPYAGATREITAYGLPGNFDFASGSHNPNGLLRFMPPFNMLSRYREPGRVNINTMPPTAANAIWAAIHGATAADQLPSGAPPWSDVIKSVTDESPNLRTTGRRVQLDFGSSVKGVITLPFCDAAGHTGVTAASFEPDDIEATQVDKVEVTSPAGAWYVPKALLDSALKAAIDQLLVPRSSTLLTDTANPNSGNPLRVPLLGPRVNAASRPSPTQQFPYDHRNAWFAFEPLMRAGANTTTRSEVYAIWITMGFFEVEQVTEEEAKTFSAIDFPGFPSPTFSMYPDRYRLLREYGSQSGDIRRHRGFFIYDRSIPVGYRPGVNLNVRDGLLVDRFIE